MNFLGIELRRAPAKAATTFGTDEFLRIISALSGGGSAVTPENCMQSPTVHAIVTAIILAVKVRAGGTGTDLIPPPGSTSKPRRIELAKPFLYS